MGSNNTEKVHLLAGRSWIHQGKLIRVEEVNLKTLHVITDQNGGYRFETVEDLEYFAGQCQPVGENTAIVMVDSKGDIMSRMLDGLMSDFDRLEKDPDYVQQAKQRSNHVNTAIHLAKLKLQMGGK